MLLPRALSLLLITAVLAGCTGNDGQDDGDSDGDLIADVNESQGRIIDISKPDGVERRQVTSDPAKADTDADELTDLDEIQRGTDPRDPDTDDDGLLDGDDVIPDDDETAAAWRQQGILDVNGTFLGELDACPPGGPQLRANVSSSDLPIADRLLDGEELRGWDVTVRGNVKHVTSDPCSPDTDADGFADHEEKIAGSDPRLPDTDHDGVNDWGDVDPTADVNLAFQDLVVETANGSARVQFLIATDSATLVHPGNSTARLNVPDGRGEGNSTFVSIVMTVTDAAGKPLRLTPDERGGAVLRFDLVQRTVDGAETNGDRVLFAGADGSMSFRWSVERR